MSAIILAIPFLAIRFGLLSRSGRGALKRAAHFAPLLGVENIAYYVYQLATAAIFVALFFLKIEIDSSVWFAIGVVLYLGGLLLLSRALRDFAAPSKNGLSTTGIYRFSRNPMYVAYLLCFLGIGLLTKSLFYIGLTVLFQTSQHWIILSEERWCAETFGDDYVEYAKQVRRYV